MIQTGEKICDSTDGSCKYGCKPFGQGGRGCTGETFRREYALEHVQRMAESIVAEAKSWGVVLTITTEPTLPLRMGGYEMAVETRKAIVVAPTIKGSWD